MVFKQVQHRAKKRHLNETMQEFITSNHPEIGENDMVEIVETRSLSLANTWEVDD